MSDISRIKRWRAGFAVALVVSVAIVVFTVYGVSGPGPQAPPPPEYGDDEEIPLTLWVTLTSIFTSVVTLIGLCVTTVIAVRKEQRDSAEARLELKKKSLEIEQLRRQMDRADSKNSTN